MTCRAAAGREAKNSRGFRPRDNAFAHVATGSAAVRAFRASRTVLVGFLSAAGSFAVVSSPGCGTDAHGIEDCREIEQTRCAAAVPCGIITDQPRCETFYRDHCLHGLPGTQPQQATIDLCVSAIKALGECAKLGGAQAELSSCPGVQTHDATLVCEVIQFPERAYDCSFLSSKPPPEPGSGGEGGGAGSDG